MRVRIPPRAQIKPLAQRTMNKKDRTKAFSPNSPNVCTGSVLGLAELLGISHGKMRTLIGHLCAAGLITSKSSNKGTAFRLTDRGEQVLNFTSADVDDFSTILSVIQRPFGIAILHIIKQLTHNAL